MGHARTQTGQHGGPRYAAYYDDLRGRRRSAGTYSTRREADAAWQRAEAKLAEGRIGGPRRGRQTSADFFALKGNAAPQVYDLLPAVGLGARGPDRAARHA